MAAATLGRDLAQRRSTRDASRKGGLPLFEVRTVAGRAFWQLAASDQRLELVVAGLTGVLVEGHFEGDLRQ